MQHEAAKPDSASAIAASERPGSERSNGERSNGSATAAPDRRPALNDRQRRIVERVRQDGYTTIDALAQAFAVTPQTIRRDINLLNDAGLLRRFHGGAGAPSSVENVDYGARRTIFEAEKRRIGAAVAAAIPDDAALSITIGTTTEAVAQALAGRRGLRIITNNLNVANLLAPSPDIELIVAGGLVRNRDRAIVGEAAIDFFRQFRVDYAVIGISGIDADGSLLDFDYREVRVAQTIIANARTVFLAADHSKFGRRPMVRLGHIEQIDGFFTDRPLDPAMARLFAAANVTVRIAGEPA